MLDSLLNRHKQIICLDRFVINDDNNDRILITDPDQIKKAMVYHFQNVVGSTHTPKTYTSELGFLIDPKNHNRLIDRSYIFMIDQKSMNLIDHVQSTF